MKKIIIALGLAFLLVSCSSDDQQKISNYPYPQIFYPDQGLVQKEVKIAISESDFMFLKKNHGNPTYIHQIPMHEIPAIIACYKQNNYYRAFDSDCPYDWGEKLGGIILTGNIFTCRHCNSTFDPNTFEALSGPAKEKGLRLVEYKMIYVDDEYIGKENWFQITNPNYKNK